jgi:hypothetical protein
VRIRIDQGITNLVNLSSLAAIQFLSKRTPAPWDSGDRERSLEVGYSSALRGEQELDGRELR